MPKEEEALHAFFGLQPQERRCLTQMKEERIVSKVAGIL